MTWFKVDDKFYDHPKVIASGATAIGVWLMCGTWAANHLTDGYVPDEIVRRFIPRTVKNANIRQKLIDTGLWEDAGDGVRFRDWTDYQPTKEKVRAKREASRERQARHRSGSRRGTEEGPKRDARGTEEGQDDDGLFALAAGQTKIKKSRNGVTASVPTRPVEQNQASPGFAVVPLTRNGGTIIKAWIDACETKPDKRMVGRIAGEVNRLLENHAWEVVNQALADWHRFGFIQADKLGAIVYRLENPRDPLVAVNGGMSTADQRVAAGLALVAKYEQQENLGQKEIMG